MDQKYPVNLWDVSALKIAEYNPRKISNTRLDELKKSIQSDPDFLHARPIMVNTLGDRRGVIVGGNMRFLAAKELGMSKVPCVEVSLDLQKEKVWNVRDNSHHGEWDMEALENLVKEQPPAFDLALPSDMLGEILQVDVPSFGEGSPEDQGALDRKKDIVCPACGETFQP